MRHEVLEALIAENWERLLSEAFLFAKGERLGELLGTYLKRRDGRGLDTYSLIWGEIQAYENLLPSLAQVREVGGVPCNPVTMRKAAYQEANEQYAERVLRKAKEAEDEVAE